MDEIKVTLIQPDIIWENPEQNLSKYQQIFNQIEDTPHLIVLPEMFSTGFSTNPNHLAEPIHGKTVTWMKECAYENNLAIAGSIIIEDKDKYYNRFIFCNQKGNIYSYDKRHLFRMNNEEKNYDQGKKRVIIDFEEWKILPQICYDLRFPVWSRNQNNYDLLIYVANWPEARRDAWKTLLKARAIENYAYTIGVNRVGTDGRYITYSGDSMIIDPQGEILCELEPYKENFVTASLSLKKLYDYKIKFPVYKDVDDFRIVGLEE